MGGRSERRFFWTFSVVILLLLAVGVTSYRSLARTSEAAGWRDHTRLVLAQLSELFTALMDVETSQRGFTLTGREDFLDPYHLGTEDAPKALAELQRLTVDNPQQQDRLKRLQVEVARKLDYAREVIVTRRRIGFEAAQAITLSGEGKRLTDGIRQLMGEMEREERRLLSEREAILAADERLTGALVIGGNALALVVMAVAAFLMIRGAGVLRLSLQAIREQEWLQSGLAALATVLREERPVDQLARAVLDHLGAHLAAPVGALYRRDGSDGSLHQVAGLALDRPRRSRVQDGETLVGEASRLRRVIELAQVPASRATCW
jgi:CHASE3 domain sensor protein